MKAIIVLCALFGASMGAWTPGLRVKFNLGIFGFGSEYFYDMPKDLNDAKQQGWLQYFRPVGPYPELELYCYQNLIVCLLFDDTEAVVGLQIALPESAFTGNPLDPTTQGFTLWMPPNRSTYWTIQQYFVSEDYLALTKEERIQFRTPGKTLQEDAVWLTTFNKALLKVSADVDTIIASNDFTVQACIPWMGTHYYYNMTKDMQCTADKVSTWFPLTDSGELIGMGFMVFGQMVIDQQRDWFEHPSMSEVQLIVTSGPDCLYEMVEQYGVATMHVYYIENPRQVFCSIFG